jgi:hypothetical protein
MIHTVVVGGLADGSGSTWARATVSYAIEAALEGDSDIVLPLVCKVPLQGALAGSGDLTPASPTKTLLVGGHARGRGDLLDPYTIDRGGVVTGSGDLTATYVVRKDFHESLLGVGRVVLSLPDPLRGSGRTAAYVEVARNLIARPCSRTKHGSIEVRWGQMLTRGDLPLYLDEGPMRPFAPYLLSYTLYLIREGGYAQQVGASGRTPVMARVGEFYATGEAGVGGQPGLWRITWKWQRSAGMPFETYSYNFRVTDAATLNDPNDTTPRCRKYGWL